MSTYEWKPTNQWQSEWTTPPLTTLVNAESYYRPPILGRKHQNGDANASTSSRAPRCRCWLSLAPLRPRNRPWPWLPANGRAGIAQGGGQVGGTEEEEGAAWPTASPSLRSRATPTLSTRAKANRGLYNKKAEKCITPCDKSCLGKEKVFQKCSYMMRGRE